MTNEIESTNSADILSDEILRQANDSDTPTELPATISKSHDETLRGEVALNPIAPREMLQELKNDNSNDVLSCLTKRKFNVREQLIICIAGKNDIAVNGLTLLAAKYGKESICFIPNSTDDGLDGWQPSLKKAGRELGIREVTLEDIYEIVNLIYLSLESTEIIKTENFSTNKLFNIHFSLLPKYRGMFTSAVPLLYGENYSGVTLHKIDNGIDTGEIIDQIKFDIDADDTARDLYFKYLENAFVLLQRNIDNLINDCYVSKPQLPNNASYFSRKSIDYKNLFVNFFKTAYEVRNQFRAFTFREYQMPRFEGKEIFKAEILDVRSKSKPGTKLFENDEVIIVTTIDYDLRLYKDYYRIFWQSCELGDISTFNSVTPKIVNFDLTNSKGWNAIVIATYYGHLEIVKKLVELGADVNTKSTNGTTLLMYAVSYYQRSKDSDLFKYLLELGSDTLSADKYGKTLEQYVIESRCEALLNFLH